MPEAMVLGMLLVGVGATLVMDLWALFLRSAFNVPSLDYRLVGRWLLYMPQGQFRHGHIAKTPAKAGESVIGWTAHYLIGIAFAYLLVIPSGGRWLEQPSLLPALLVGVATVALPFFIMQPAFGFGVAAAKVPNPTSARLKSLLTHAVFGMGLYLAALPVRYGLNLSIG